MRREEREREGMEEERGKVTEGIGGTGQDTGWGGEGRERKGGRGEKARRGATAPKFNPGAATDSGECSVLSPGE